MSTLTSSEIIEDLVSDKIGRRDLRLRYTVEDNNSASSDIDVLVVRASAATDANALLAARGAALIASLEDAEDQEAIAAAETAEDSLILMLNPAHSSSKRIAKALIYEMMDNRDPRFVIWLEPLIEYLRANYTPTQLSNFLDLSISKLQKMDARIDAILEAPGVSASVKDQLVIMDDNEGIE